MKCPKCGYELMFLKIDDSISMMERRYYICEKCGCIYERLILRNEIGLIKGDTFYRLDDAGNHVEVFV